MPKTLTQLAFDDPAIETALFRHGLIAQLIHHPPDSGRLEAELRLIAAKTYVIPHSDRTRVSLTSLRLNPALPHQLQKAACTCG